MFVLLEASEAGVLAAFSVLAILCGTGACIGRRGRGRSEDIATPRRPVLSGILVVDALCARLVAICVMLILLEASEAGVLAAFAVHATLCGTGTCRGCGLTEDFASPRRPVLSGILVVDAWCTCLVAARIMLILFEARRLWILTTLGLLAVLCMS